MPNLSAGISNVASYAQSGEPNNKRNDGNVVAVLGHLIGTRMAATARTASA